MKKILKILVLNVAILLTNTVLNIKSSDILKKSEFIRTILTNEIYAQSTSFSTKEVLGEKAEFLEEEVKAGGNFITGTVRVGISVVLLFGGIVSLAFAPSTGVVFIIVGIIVAMYPKIAKGIFNSFGSTKGIFN